MVQSWNDEDIICGLNGWFHLLWEDSVIQGIKDHKIPLKPAVSKLNAEDLFQPLWFRTNLFLRMTYGNIMGYLIQQYYHISWIPMGIHWLKIGCPKKSFDASPSPMKAMTPMPEIGGLTVSHSPTGCPKKPNHRLTRWKKPSSSNHREDQSSTGWWFEPLWKIWKSIGMIIPNIWENKKCSKPPTSQVKWSSKKSWAAKLQPFFDIQKDPKQDKALELNTHQIDWIGLGQFTGHSHI